MVLVTVIIPTYNSADTLPRAIDSVFSQTIDDLELIVVDDASKDNTEEILSDYADPRLRYTSHQTNQGGSAARNTGIHLAEGKYIAFLDADDEWLPRKLEMQYNAIKKSTEDYIAVHCRRSRDWSIVKRVGYTMARLVGARKSSPQTEGGNEVIKEVLLGHLSTGASTLFVESETVRQIGGFDEKYPRHQDWEFLIRILQNGKITFVDEPLAIKHGTGRPGAETYNEAKELLLSDFEDEITTLESQGYKITKKQKFYLAKLYFEDSLFKQGFRHVPTIWLRGSEYLSLGWSLCLGLYQFLVTKVAGDNK